MAVRFSVYRANMERTDDAMQRLSGKTKTIAEHVKICRCSLRISSDSSRSIKRSLDSIHDQILEEAAQMDRLRSALEYVLKYYTVCEERIISQIENAEKGAEREADRGIDKRGGWEKLVDQIFGEDKTSSYIATTKEQQIAADLEMQRKLQWLIGLESYSENTWKSSSVEERKEILQNYMKDVSEILGVQIKDDVKFIYKEPVDGILTRGYYDTWENRIYMNEYIIAEYPSKDSYYLMSTIVHELRHAYQHTAVDNPTDFRVDQKTLEEWEYNAKNYVNSSEAGYEAYKEQALEADARAFAGQE